jgi:hypothetical protein
VFKLIQLLFSSRMALIAENLFLRKQFALLKERGRKSRRSTASIRTTMVLLSRFFDWRQALVIVKPETFIKPFGRTRLTYFPTVRGEQELIRQMAHDSWRS